MSPSRSPYCTNTGHTLKRKTLATIGLTFLASYSCRYARRWRPVNFSRGILRIRFGVRWTTYRRSAGMMKMRYHGRWHGVQRVGRKLMMRYRGKMRNVQARAGSVMMRVRKKWTNIKKRVRRVRRVRRTKRIAMKILVKGRWKTLYNRGSGYRIRYVKFRICYREGKHLQSYIYTLHNLDLFAKTLALGETIHIYNGSFSYYVIAAMLEDDNKIFLVSFYC